MLDGNAVRVNDAVRNAPFVRKAELFELRRFVPENLVDAKRRSARRVAEQDPKRRGVLGDEGVLFCQRFGEVQPNDRLELPLINVARPHSGVDRNILGRIKPVRERAERRAANKPLPAGRERETVFVRRADERPIPASLSAEVGTPSLSTRRLPRSSLTSGFPSGS